MAERLEIRDLGSVRLYALPGVRPDHALLLAPVTRPVPAVGVQRATMDEAARGRRAVLLAGLDPNGEE